MALANWRRPGRRRPWCSVRRFSTNENLSCWDCEHIRVAGQPTRRCEKDPRRHIYAPMCPDREAAEEEQMGRHGTVADRCGWFAVASEFKYLFVWLEEPA